MSSTLKPTVTHLLVTVHLRHIVVMLAHRSPGLLRYHRAAGAAMTTATIATAATRTTATARRQAVIVQRRILVVAGDVALVDATRSAGARLELHRLVLGRRRAAHVRRRRTGPSAKAVAESLASTARQQRSQCQTNDAQNGQAGDH